MKIRFNQSIAVMALVFIGLAARAAQVECYVSASQEPRASYYKTIYFGPVNRSLFLNIDEKLGKAEPVNPYAANAKAEILNWLQRGEPSVSINSDNGRYTISVFKAKPGTKVTNLDNFSLITSLAAGPILPGHGLSLVAPDVQLSIDCGVN